MGRSRPDRLDRLIDEVARGQRTLASIGDTEVRERVRLALRLHADRPAAPDPYQRMRMRARVLSGLEPSRRTARDIAWAALDIAWTALEQLGRPAPYLVRGIALAAVLLTAGLGTVVVSADTLPDDALYTVKLASEQMRLALATSPDDRAIVALSIADHRLAEAERLAGEGRTAEALIASAAYSQQIASAAADLAPTASVALADQFEQRFTAQRERARALSVTLSASSTSARAAAVLALIAAPTPAVVAVDPVQRVVETTVSVATQLVAAAAVMESAPPTPAAAPVPRTATASPAATEGSAAVVAVPAEPSAEAAAPSSPGATARTGATSSRPASAATAAPERAAPSASPTASADRHGSEAFERTRQARDFIERAAERVREWVRDHGPRDGGPSRDRGRGRGD